MRSVRGLRPEIRKGLPSGDSPRDIVIALFVKGGRCEKHFLLCILILALASAESLAEDRQPPVKWHKPPTTNPLGTGSPQEVIDKDMIVEILTGPGRAGTPAHLAFSGDAILFDYGSDRLRPESHRQLMEIAAALKNPRVAAVPFFLVDGHTCDIGTEERNCRLSLGRARRVVQFLMEKGGVPRERLQARGFGQRVPKGPNDSEANRKKNRRVELRSGFLGMERDDKTLCRDLPAKPVPSKREEVGAK